MKLRILGAHNLESRHTKYTSLLIDDVLAIDAGSLTSSLTFDEQARLTAVLVSHSHYDHIRDLPGLGLNLFGQGRHVAVCGDGSVLDALTSHWLNEAIYPRLHQLPMNRPTLQLTPIRPGESFELSGYSITPVRTNHVSNSLGFRIEDGRGRVLFYTSDTGPLAADFWNGISADLLAIEVTMPNAQQGFALSAGHLTPELLKRELSRLASASAGMPRILALHVNPVFRTNGGLATELAEVARALDVVIDVAYEGMELHI